MLFIHMHLLRPVKETERWLPIVRPLDLTTDDKIGRLVQIDCLRRLYLSNMHH